MNSRDPFNVRRSPNALATIRGQASSLTQRAINTGAQVIENGRQAVEDTMSGYSVSSNTPSFSDPSRELDNRVWGAMGPPTTHARPRAAGGYGFSNVQDKVDGMFGGKGLDLPMYKDKPYATSRRYIPLWKRRKPLAAAGLFFIFILYWTGILKSESGPAIQRNAEDTLTWLKGGSEKAGKQPDWEDRRERVVEAFKLSWDSYKRYAWGMYYGDER